MRVILVALIALSLVGCGKPYRISAEEKATIKSICDNDYNCMNEAYNIVQSTKELQQSMKASLAAKEALYPQ